MARQRLIVEKRPYGWMQGKYTIQIGTFLSMNWNFEFEITPLSEPVHVMQSTAIRGC